MKDPLPLAILKRRVDVSDRKITNRWAKEHPAAIGYIVVTDSGMWPSWGRDSRFFKIENGKSRASSAIECRPLDIAEFNTGEHTLLDAFVRDMELWDLTRELHE